MTVSVATGGTVPRNDRCAACGKPMVYRVDAEQRIVASFCPELMDCKRALIEIPEPGSWPKHERITEVELRDIYAAYGVLGRPGTGIEPLPDMRAIYRLVAEVRRLRALLATAGHLDCCPWADDHKVGCPLMAEALAIEAEGNQ